MAWIYLILAGLLEMGFTTSLKLSNGFTKPLPIITFLICGGLSFTLLTKAIQTIPLGTAYAVWTGLGASGTAVLGIIFFKESADFWRIFFITLLISSIVGLKFVSADH